MIAAETFGMWFSGFIAWWLWQTIYPLKLPDFERIIAGGERLDA